MLQRIQQKLSNYHVSFKNEAPKMVPIAPAPEKKYLTLNLQENKKYCYKNNNYSGAQAASIARRNARERNRVKQVNDGFNELRKRLPSSVISALSGGARRGSGKKLSKVDTLRMVVEYIRYLQSLVEESDASQGITKTLQPFETPMSFEMDEGVFSGSSPYSDSVPSPAGSDSSSGYSNGYIPNNSYAHEEQASPMEDEDLFDTMSWWQK